MNTLTSRLVLAQAPAATTGPSTQPGEPVPWWANQWFPLILAMGVLYFFVFRSKSKQEKQRTEMLSALKKGDRIQTIGGILGTVVEVGDDEVVVKVDESTNTKLTFSRNAIHRVREEAKK